MKLLENGVQFCWDIFRGGLKGSDVSIEPIPKNTIHIKRKEKEKRCGGQNNAEASSRHKKARAHSASASHPEADCNASTSSPADVGDPVLMSTLLPKLRNCRRLRMRTSWLIFN